jgi:hypothetical protein
MAMAVQNTVLYGSYRNRTHTHKTQALDGTVMVINGHIMAPYGSTSIISIRDIMYVCASSHQYFDTVTATQNQLKVINVNMSTLNAAFDKFCH